MNKKWRSIIAMATFVTAFPTLIGCALLAAFVQVAYLQWWAAATIPVTLFLVIVAIQWLSETLIAWELRR